LSKPARISPAAAHALTVLNVQGDEQHTRLCVLEIIGISKRTLDFLVRTGLAEQGERHRMPAYRISGDGRSLVSQWAARQAASSGPAAPQTETERKTDG
jgi:hypothetical protein